MMSTLPTGEDTDHELSVVLRSRTRLTSSRYPYVHRPVWARFRDWTPHILADGPRVLAAVARLADRQDIDAGAVSVVRQVVNTAAITAPPDLWILRQVVGALAEVGLAAPLVAGDVLRPASSGLLEAELIVDLRFLLARGTLVRTHDGYRLADHAAARAVMSLPPPEAPEELSAVWAAAFAGDAAAVSTVRELVGQPLPGTEREPGFWHPTAADVELGFRLVPLVVGMRMAGITEPPPIALPVFTAAGLVEEGGALNELGRRVVERGPGPFGIIEAYRSYLGALPTLWRRGRGSVWVERSANVAASQEANARTFRQANDALDRFCEDTGFTYDVFIEHAVGRGEATRQRYERQGDALTYVGADLEDAAIDAALAEQQAGRLPGRMHFIRKADIGQPGSLLGGLQERGVAPEGAVMVVGNGFHEVREQTDERMTEVFRGYERAGLVLIFTEETALFVDDLLETGWNTYHAGFKYVHERSGQGLRPAVSRPPSSLEGPLPASWTECAERAGYVRAEAWCARGRTVYPYTPPNGHNPSISVNHFFVPKTIATALGLV